MEETFGKILSSARKKAGLSIEQVSERTKIRPHIILAIEKEDLSIMPFVYYKSFLKTYCKFLKIPESAILNSFENSIKTLQKSIEPEQPSYIEPEEARVNKVKRVFTLPKIDFQNFNFYKKKNLKQFNKSVLINFIIYGVLIVALLVLLFFLLFPVDSGNSYSKKTTGNHTGSDTNLLEQQAKKVLSYFEQQTRDSLTLEALASDTVWIRIESDGKKNEQLRMFPGNEKKWFASQYFILTVGNAGGVDFKRNGSALAKFGPKGTVVNNIKITKDNIINPSQNWKSDTTKPVTRKKKKEQNPAPKPEPPRIIEPTEFKPKPYKQPRLN